MILGCQELEATALPTVPQPSALIRQKFTKFLEEFMFLLKRNLFGHPGTIFQIFVNDDRWTKISGKTKQKPIFVSAAKNLKEECFRNF